MPIPFPFDFKNPDYGAVLAWRAARIDAIRADPSVMPQLRVFYRNNPAQFITDWGCTYDPRNLERGLPATIPFLLFPRQEEWVAWIMERWRAREDGITEKTRDMGVSWLFMSLACTLCLFRPGMSIGCGSRKEEYVDVLGDPDTLFEKARLFMDGLPVEFRGGWERKKHAAYMRMQFPETEAILTGEAGDEIGRGGRQGIYLVDESSRIARSELLNASLSATTNCRQDVATPRGRANAFAERRFSGKVPVFTFHWRDDPRKGEDWYAEQVAKRDPVTLAQEVDIDYNASVEGVLIPSAWIQAAIGAFQKLGIVATGRRSCGLDVADEGIDLNAWTCKEGVELIGMEAWSGKGGDIFRTTQRAFQLAESHNAPFLYYDADGLGAGVRGDARIINEGRKEAGELEISCAPYRGSGAVHDPDGDMEPKAKRKNKDRFENFKAQAWWSLRHRFMLTWRAVVEGMAYNPDDLISIRPDLPDLHKLTAELSQPTWELNKAGKIMITKTPVGMRSPNYADSVCIAYQPGARTIEVWAALGNAA